MSRYEGPPDAEPSPEVDPINKELLRKLFSSPQLRRKLEESVRKVIRKPDIGESGFAVLKDLLSPTTHFTEVIEGGVPPLPDQTSPRLYPEIAKHYQRVHIGEAIERTERRLQDRFPERSFPVLCLPSRGDQGSGSGSAVLRP